MHLITTRKAPENAWLTLLDLHLGPVWPALPRLRAAADHLDSQHIHLIRDSNGQPLIDIRTPDENARLPTASPPRCANSLPTPTMALHRLWIAGGRKTMGFYLYASRCLAREQDRLSHVPVGEPFEGNHKFYYPPREPLGYCLPAKTNRSAPLTPLSSSASIPLLATRQPRQRL